MYLQSTDLGSARVTDASHPRLASTTVAHRQAKITAGAIREFLFGVMCPLEYVLLATFFGVLYCCNRYACIQTCC